MEVIRGLENIKKIYRNPVVTLGNFDGVHVGHQKILRRVKDTSKKEKGISMVITFDPHPTRIISPEKGLRILTPFDIKAELIKKTGIDLLICIDFNREFSSIKPDDFIKNILVEKLCASHVIVGHNYRFGRGKKGTPELIRRRGKKCGFNFNVVRNRRLLGGVVSSSRVRNLLLHGKVDEASTLLGRPYFIEGSVIPGAGRGARMLNTPTANLTTPNELVPKDGVYVVEVRLNGELFNGVASIGKNPTFGEGDLSYEVHLFDFNGDIRGRNLRVYFIELLRDEEIFSNPVELKNQIFRDIEAAKTILKKIHRRVRKARRENKINIELK